MFLTELFDFCVTTYCKFKNYCYGTGHWEVCRYPARPIRPVNLGTRGERLPLTYTIALNRFFHVSADIIGFSCPDKVDPHSVSAKFEPYPRFALPGDSHRLISCVHGHPRLISCGEGSVVDESSLTCVE